MIPKLKVLIGVGVFLLAGLVVFLLTPLFSGKPTIEQLKKAFEAADYASARELGVKLLATELKSDWVLMKTAESCQQLQELEDALKFYNQVSEADRGVASIARWAAAEVLFFQGKMSPCLQKLEKSIELDSMNDRARERLIEALHLVGRRWEALAVMGHFARRDNWQFDRMLALGNPVKPIENERELNRFIESDPSDSLPKLGLARTRIREGKFDEAETLLGEVLRQFPETVEAHVQLGKVLLASRPNSIPDWEKSLPKNAGSHPDIWWIRGEWCRHDMQIGPAARCFSEALRLDPDHAAANYGMAQALVRLDREEESLLFAKRVSTIEQLTVALDQVNPKTKYLPPMETVAEKTFELGRQAESWAWTRLGLTINSRSKTLIALSEELKKKSSPLMELRSASGWTIRGDTYRDLPLPNWDKAASGIEANSEKSKDLGQLGAGNSLFQEVNPGLDFVYFASREPPIVGRRMFESTGGGIGVLDFDHDGWPDLFFSQGTVWPVDGNDSAHSDRLMKNRGSAINEGDARFEDVTLLAGIREAAFGQGVGVGDINNDGFDDIYVANVGTNQWWINQGDGTFRDGNKFMDSPDDAWTVSVFIADVNGDGRAEVYDARYVEGNNVYERLCNVNGQPRTCPPTVFTPSKGRLMTPNDQGILTDISQATMSESVHEGNALGVVVFRELGEKLPSVFVGNDQIANLYLKPIPSQNAPLGFVYEDEALPRGLAFDALGRAQACMGIASGDVDQDGRLDLLVTNFLGEYNTLYLQKENGFFQDSSSAAKLVAPSLDMLGFGAQFLDADLNGTLDLVLVNGHIDDLTHADRPFRMRPQFFVGSQAGVFTEQIYQDDPFFSKPALGRALALIDCNRDGRMDFVTTDLETNSKLMLNTGRDGHYVDFTCVGTQSHRDAIGVTITIHIGDSKRTSQLVAGCGYLVSNQKVIHFGVGASTQIDSVVVSWPSGQMQRFENIPTNAHFQIIEGTGITRLEARD